jgi:hypothetical protein
VKQSQCGETYETHTRQRPAGSIQMHVSPPRRGHDWVPVHVLDRSRGTAIPASLYGRATACNQDDREQYERHRLQRKVTGNKRGCPPSIATIVPLRAIRKKGRAVWPAFCFRCVAGVWLVERGTFPSALFPLPCLSSRLECDEIPRSARDTDSRRCASRISTYPPCRHRHQASAERTSSPPGSRTPAPRW